MPCPYDKTHAVCPYDRTQAVSLRQNDSANRFPVPCPPLSDHTNPPSPDTSISCALHPATDYGNAIIGTTSSATKTNCTASANTSAPTRPVGRRTPCIPISPRSPVKPVNRLHPTVMRRGWCRGRPLCLSCCIHLPLNSLKFRLPKRPFFKYKEIMSNPNNPAYGTRRIMTTLTEIERAVTSLSRKDFNTFRDWFSTLENRKWDREFEKDAQKGLLDDLANEALADFNSGACKEL
ncbi:hypothetical protein KKHLCK_05300 [Candidatus Electrothrix laxa]